MTLTPIGIALPPIFATLLTFTTATPPSNSGAPIL